MATGFNPDTAKKTIGEKFKAWEDSLKGSQARYGYSVEARKHMTNAVYVKVSMRCRTLRHAITIRTHIEKESQVDLLQKTMDGLEALAWLNFDEVSRTKSKIYLPKEIEN